MTSMPASLNAVAITLAPRSWPSSPTLATKTLIGRFIKNRLVAQKYSSLGKSFINMQYRKFGNTDLLVSEIGFGAWAIGGGAMIGSTAIGWGDVDDNESIAAINTSLEEGINFFDTADIYGLGHSEDLLGKVIGHKKEVIIATKVGNVSRNEQFTIDYSKEYILAACAASLKRLNRETIDYYQLHTARLQHLQQGDCIEAMQQLKQEGNTSLLLFSFDYIISYLSKFFTLRTGDLIFTGTPKGVSPVAIGNKLSAYIENEKLLEFEVK